MGGKEKAKEKKKNREEGSDVREKDGGVSTRRMT